MSLIRYNDPDTGRPASANTLRPDEPEDPTNIVGPAGSALQQMFLDNITDGKRHQNEIVWEDGVADWNGSTGTDNGTAFDAVITQAIAQSGHTEIIIPPGRYYVGNAARSYNLQTEVTIRGVGDVEIIGDAPSSIVAFNGALSSAGFGTVVTLDGNHDRTPRIMGDGQTYYDGVETFTFNEDHNANVGDYFMLYDNTQSPWATGAGAPIYHISPILQTPTTKSITVSIPSLFNFLDGETGFICPFWGPLHLKNIKWNNIRNTGSNSCVRTYRVCHSSVEDCEFIGNNPDGTSDHFLCSDSMDWRFERCKWTNARYGILANRVWHFVARDHEVIDTRHFLSAASTSAHGLCENIWGRDNVSLVNGHLPINWTWRNVVDIGGYAGVDKNDMFNMRANGFTLENVYWEGYADGVGNKNIYLGCHVDYNSDYVDLLWRFPINITNVSFQTRTPANVNLRRGGVVTINGLSLGGGGFVELGNSDEGIIVLHGEDTIIGSSDIRFFKVGGADADLERYSGTFESSPAPTATTAVLPSDAIASSSTEGAHDGSLIELTGGTGAGQWKRITAYTVVGGTGSDHEITVDSDWSPVPDGTTTYAINCTNIRCDNNAVGKNWGIARKRVSDEIIDGPSESKLWRVRIWPIVTGAEETARYESVIVTIKATTHAGSSPGFGRWDFLFDNKSIPSRGVAGPFLLHESPHRLGRKMTLALSDIRVDPGATAGPGWFEFTMQCTTEENAVALFCEAESIGAN